ASGPWRHDVGRRGTISRRERPWHPRRAARPRARSRPTRAGRAPRSHRGAQPAVVRVTRAARGRARHRAPRGARCGAARAVQAVGAWLSVAAVAAVIWAGRATERLPKAARLLAPAVAATLLTAPITAFTFGTVAPIGVVANLAAIPLAGLAVPGLMVALLISSSWLAA